MTRVVYHISQTWMIEIRSVSLFSCLFRAVNRRDRGEVYLWLGAMHFWRHQTPELDTSQKTLSITKRTSPFKRIVVIKIFSFFESLK